MPEANNLQGPKPWRTEDIRNTLNDTENHCADAIVNILKHEALFSNYDAILKVVRADLLDHERGLEIEYARENKYEGENGSQFI